MLHLQEQTKLAIRALKMLQMDRRIRRSTLVVWLDCSANTLAKVIQKLRCANIVDTKQGPKGGVRLVQPLHQVPILKVFYAIQGFDTLCGLHDRKRRRDCTLCQMIESMQCEMMKRCVEEVVV